MRDVAAFSDEEIQKYSDRLNAPENAGFNHEEWIENLRNYEESLIELYETLEEGDDRAEPILKALNNVHLIMTGLTFAADNAADAVDEAGNPIKQVGEDAEATAERLSKVKDDLNELSAEYDALTAAYDTLSAAADEYNGSGALSIDTFERLMSLAPEYIGLLETEGGQVSVNTDGYYRLTSAKIDDMVETKALEYATAVLTAAEQGNAAQVATLTGTVSAHRSATAEDTAEIIGNIQALEEQGEVARGTAAKTEQRVNAIRRWGASAKASLGSYASSAGRASGAAKSLARSTKDLAAEAERLAKAAWSSLTSAVDAILKRRKKELDKQADAIDRQIEALKEARDVENEQKELEEKKLAVLEKERALSEAERERTIRVYNGESGQWEWVADQKLIKDAEDALDEAKKELDDYLDERAYLETIAALEGQRDAIKAQYEAFADEWERIKDSIETPAQDLADALAEINANGTPQMKAVVGDVNALLASMGISLAGFVGTVKETVAALGGSAAGSGSLGGGYSGGAFSSASAGSGGLSGGDDVKMPETLAVIPAPKTEASAVGHAIGIQGLKRSAGAVGSRFKKREELVYDSGGIADKKGLMAKAVDAPEAVLSPELTAKLLTPKSNAEFKAFADSLGILFGAANTYRDAGFERISGGPTVNNSGASYYINGISIDEGSAESMSLKELVNMLPLYLN